MKEITKLPQWYSFFLVFNSSVFSQILASLLWQQGWLGNPSVQDINTSIGLTHSASIYKEDEILSTWQWSLVTCILSSCAKFKDFVAIIIIIIFNCSRKLCNKHFLDTVLKNLQDGESFLFNPLKHFSHFLWKISSLLFSPNRCLQPCCSSSIF